MVKQFGPYTINSRLGKGGFGVAYLAEDAHGASVVVKTLHQPGDREARERLKRELSSGERVNSRYVARLLDFDVEADQPWLAFAYVPGRDLTDVIRDAPIEYDRVAKIAMELAEAIFDMSEQGVVHRDLKPDNIRIGVNDSVTVLDLGIAWSAEMTTLTTAVAIGTEGYIAPEAFQGGSPRSTQDVWAYGLIVAKIAGVRHPFVYAFGSQAELIHATLYGDPDLNSTPWPWRPISADCLRRDPDERPRPGDLRAAVRNSNHLVQNFKPLLTLGDDDRDWALATIAVLQGTLNAQWADAVATSRLIEQGGVRDEVLTFLVGSMVQQDVLEQARRATALIQEPAQQDQALLDLGRGLAMAGDTPGAWETATWFNDQGFAPALIESIAQAHAESGDTDEALRTLSGIFAPGTVEAEEALHRLVKAVTASGPRRRAAITPALLEAVQESDDLLSKLGRSQAEAGDIQGALQTAELVHNDRFKDRVLDGLRWRMLKEGQTSEALSVAARIRNARGKDANLSAVAAELAERGHISLAQQVVAEINAERLGSKARQGIASAQYRQSGDPEEVRCTIGEISDASYRDSAYIDLAVNLALEGNWSEVEATLTKTSDRNDSGWAVADGLARKGRISEALMFANDLYSPHRDYQTDKLLNRAVVFRYSEDGDPDAILELASQTRTRVFRQRALVWAALAEARRGRAEGALALLQRVFDHDEHSAPDSLPPFFHALWTPEQRSLIEPFLRRMMRRIAENDDIEPEVSAVTRLVHRPAYHRIKGRRDVVELQLRGRDTAGALATARGGAYPYERAHLMVEVAVAQAAWDGVDSALNTLSELPQEIEYEPVFRQVVEVVERSGWRSRQPIRRPPS